MSSRSLAEYFTDSVGRHPDRPALHVDGREHGYRELGAVVARLALELDAVDATPIVAVYARRQMAAYAAILAALVSGRAYVPLNPRFPAARNLAILERSGAGVIVCGTDALEEVGALAAGASQALTVVSVAHRIDDVPARSPAGLEHRHLPWTDDAATALRPRPREPGALAYLLFTSGTTGVPKGVPITHGNARAYVDRIVERYDFGQEDRFSQTFDLTFDLSVHDMFVCWASGGCLCVLPESALMAPVKFVREQTVTVWFSVPSTVGFMRGLRLLRPGALATLRYSLFCGEGLPAAAARSWCEAAPDTVLENLYGPTEATIAFTGYRWRGDESDAALAAGLVPIGQPFPGLETAILDARLEPVDAGTVGELWLGGDQLSPGYWHDEEKTATAFVELELEGKRAKRWYRTGDLAREDGAQLLHFLGRADGQVKIRGHRVELGEIEHVVRGALGLDLVAAVPWPVSDGTAGAVVVFVGTRDEVEDAALDACRRTLPAYMVPSAVRALADMPLNANGKIDRGRLRSLLESESNE